jgi:hypothetical protein
MNATTIDSKRPGTYPAGVVSSWFQLNEARPE